MNWYECKVTVLAQQAKLYLNVRAMQLIYLLKALKT